MAPARPAAGGGGAPRPRALGRILTKLPEPPDPATLAAHPPALVALPVGALLFRVYFRGGPYPTTWNAFRRFGPTGARFDHHLTGPDGAGRLQERAILYAAALARTCLAEVFQRTRTINRRRRQPWLAAFEARRAVLLLDLRGTWITSAGASSAITRGPRSRARRWSQAFYAAYPQIDGLIYPSSMGGNADALALYERAADALPGRPRFNRALADPVLEASLGDVAGELGYAII